MKMLDYAGAAAIVAVPVGTLYAWVHEDRIPYVRLGPRTVRFDEADLAAWLEERRRGPASATRGRT